jgi:hypothetical protein
MRSQRYQVKALPLLGNPDKFAERPLPIWVIESEDPHRLFQQGKRCTHVVRRVGTFSDQ